MMKSGFIIALSMICATSLAQFNYNKIEKLYLECGLKIYSKNIDSVSKSIIIQTDTISSFNYSSVIIKPFYRLIKNNDYSRIDSLIRLNYNFSDLVLTQTTEEKFGIMYRYVIKNPKGNQYSDKYTVQYFDHIPILLEYSSFLGNNSENYRKFLNFIERIKEYHKINEFEGITIEQDGKRINITQNTTEINLDKMPFSLEFEVFPYNPEKEKWYAVQIAATANKDNLKYFKEGEIGDQNPFLSPGTGMASEEGKPYSSMVIRDDGNHYIYYENESHRRADLVEKKDNGKVRLKWNVNLFWVDDKEIEIAKSSFKEIYIMIFIDNNLNKIIEKGEYNLLKLKFK
jgi:hypothetical protein